MKKKLLTTLATFALLVCSVFTFAGCDLFGPKVTAIEIKNEFKTVYQLGESLDLTGGIMKVSLSNNTKIDEFITEENVSVSGFNTDTVGQRTMILTHKGVTCTVDYTVTHFVYTEDRYLWHNSTRDMYVYIYKENNVYKIIEYRTDDSSPSLEWLKLQDAQYRTEEAGASYGYQYDLSFELNTNDYYYNMIVTPGEDDPITTKIISIDNVLREGQNLFDGYIRYTPAS